MDRALRRRSGCAELADDARFAVADLRREHREELEALLAARFLAKTDARVVGRARRRRRAERDPGRHEGRRPRAVRRRQRAPRARRRVRAPDHGPPAPVRRADPVLRTRRRNIDTPPPRVGENTREILELAGLRRRPRSTRSWTDERRQLARGRVPLDRSDRVRVRIRPLGPPSAGRTRWSRRRRPGCRGRAGTPRPRSAARWRSRWRPSRRTGRAARRHRRRSGRPRRRRA